MIDFFSSANLKTVTFSKNAKKRRKVRIFINRGVVNKRIKYPNNAIDLVASILVESVLFRN